MWKSIDIIQHEVFGLDANTIGLIIAGVLFAAPVVIVGVVVIRIIIQIKSFERESGIKLRRKDFVDDLKKTGSVGKNPASLNGMDKIYLPQIHKDFPDFQLAAVIPQVETVIKSYLDSIEDKDTSALERLSISPSLIDRVQQIIVDINSRNIQVNYDNIVIHRTVISDYVHENGMVIIKFQSAVGYLHFAQNQKGKLISGSKDTAEETVYVTSYARILDSELARQSGAVDVLGLNCPNCGAALSSASAGKCLFCGTPFQNLTEDVFGWTFTDIKEKNRMTQKLY